MLSRRGLFGLLGGAAAAAAVAKVTPAPAANLPVPPKGVTVEQMREAIADQERRRKMPQKKFEDLLSAPIGKGRLE